MESRRKRSRSQIIKWVCYTLLMLLCTVLQTTPGPVPAGARQSRSGCCRWRWPSRWKRASSPGRIFGAVCGLMWDYTAGRTVGMLAL